MRNHTLQNRATLVARHGQFSRVKVYALSEHCLITHAGCIAAGLGRAFSRVCLFVCLFVRALKNGLSYHHQSQWTYSPSQDLRMY